MFMKKYEAYTLYLEAKRFIESLKQENFKAENISYAKGNWEIYAPVYPNAPPNHAVRIGEIINNKFLIIYTSDKKQKDRLHRKAISKLQKLAKEFKVR